MKCAHYRGLCIFFLMLSACAEERIPVGFIGSLTGRYSELGVSGRNGAQMAVDHINAQGGVRGAYLELLPVDNGADPEKTRDSLVAMAARGVRVVIGPMLSRSGPGVLDALEKAELLVFSPTISSVHYYQRNDRLLLANASSLEGGRILGAVVYDRAQASADPYDSIYVVLDAQNQQYIQDFYRGLKLGAPQAKWILDSIDGVGRTSYFVAREIVHKHPRAVVLVTSGADAAAFAQGMAKGTSTVVALYGSAWTQTPELLEQGGRQVEGMLILSTLQGTSAEGVIGNFAKEYHERYGALPTFASELSYEVVWNLAHAMDSVGIHPGKLHAALLGMKSLKGLSESWRLDANGDPVRSFSLVEIRDGLFHQVQQIWPRSAARGIP